jgi:nucleoside-diphosphate-sugar epimerase
VDDLIEAMILMMIGPTEFPGPVNIGNPGEYTMLELEDGLKGTIAYFRRTLGTN